MINKRVLLFFFVIMTSCIPNEPEFEGFRRVELIRLLSADEQKSWTLESRFENGEVVNLEACEDARQLLFSYTSNTNDRDSLFYINPGDTCGSDTLKGFWFIPQPLNTFTATDTLVFVWQSTDTGYFSVNEITPEYLEIQSLFSLDSLLEQFSGEQPGVIDSLQSRK